MKDNWISVKTKRPKLCQKCYCYSVMTRYDGKIMKSTRLLYYLKYKFDNRRMVFSEKDVYRTNIGGSNWPVTHWMPLPEPPTTDK